MKYLLTTLFILSSFFFARFVFAETASLDFTPPRILSVEPTGTLIPGTAEMELFVDTDEPAECRYTEGGGIEYENMNALMATSTDGRRHSALARGLKIAQSYIFSIRCMDVFGNTNTEDTRLSVSVAGPVDGLDLIRPAAPPALKINSFATTSVSLSWGESYDNSEVRRYRVYRCDGGGCRPSRSIGESLTTFFTDTGLAPLFPYSYQITAIDDSQNESLRSWVVSATTTGAVAENTASAAIGANDSEKQTFLDVEKKRRDIMRQIDILLKMLARLISLLVMESGVIQ